MVQQVGECLAADGDLQLAHAGEVGLAQASRDVLLREEHLASAAAGGAPLFHMPLQRSQLAIGELSWKTALQVRHDRLGFQPGLIPQMLFDLRPYGLERIGPRSPLPFPLDLARQFAVGQVLPGRLDIHSGLRGRNLLCLLCFRQLLQPPDLYVIHHLQAPEGAIFDDCR